MRQERRLPSGIGLKRAERGILCMARLVGRTGSCMKKIAKIAVLLTALPFLLALVTALGIVFSLPVIRTLSIKDRARYAVLNFLCEHLAENKSSVAVSARQKVEGKRAVYNLTLENHNVYYANGLLVENCADALMMSCYVPSVDSAPVSINFEGW